MQSGVYGDPESAPVEKTVCFEWHDSPYSS